MMTYIKHKTSFSKHFIFTLTLVFSLSFFSCNNLSSDSSQNQRNNEQPVITAGTNKGIVKISLKTPEAKKSRTGLPENLSIYDFTNFKLTGYHDEKNYDLGNWEYTSYLQNASIELEAGEWALTLSASYKNFSYSSVYNLEVEVGLIHQVGFVLSTDSMSGDLSVQIEFNSYSQVDHVNYQIVKYPAEENIESGSLPVYWLESNKYVSLTKESTEALQNGTYRLLLSFYADTNEKILLNNYSELIRIKGGRTTTVTRVISLNELFTIHYMNIEDAEIVSGSLIENYSINSDYSQITFPELSRPNYIFRGWLTESGTSVTSLPTGSTGDQWIYADWEPFHALTYQMVNNVNELYDVSDSLREAYNLPAYHNPLQETDLTVYEISDGTSPITCTFYKDSYCTDQISGGKLPASSITSDTTIFIKPVVTHVYVAPDKGVDYSIISGTGNDQFPFNSNTPAQTVAYAKKWLKNSDSALNPVLYVMSSISEGVGELSDLSLSIASGGEYGSAIVKRHPSFTNGYLIDMLSGTATVSNLVLDGGADWRDATNTSQPLAASTNVDEGVNNGITATAGLIRVKSGATLNMQNVTLRNNESHNTGNNAKNIEIISGGVLDISQSSITRCKADLGGALWASGKVIANTITMSYNCAVYNGGAVLAAAASNIKFEQSSFISNIADCGGAVYNMASEHPFYSITNSFENNCAYSHGNILYNTGDMTLAGSTAFDETYENNFYIDNATNHPIKIESNFVKTGTTEKIKLYPVYYYSGTTSPVFDKNVFDFSSLTTTLNTVKAYFELDNSSYIIDDSGIIKPIPGTIVVTPGFPGTYSCSYTMTKRSSGRKIKIILKKPAVAPATQPTPLDISLINSISVKLYETGDHIATWSGTAEDNKIADAMNFNYPSYMPDPTNTSFYVEVSIKPSADSSVAYSYDFYATCDGTFVPMSNVTVPAGSFDTSATLCADNLQKKSSVFIQNRSNVSTIRSLIASDHEVTQGEYGQYCKYGDSTYAPSGSSAGEKFPAYGVSWYDAIVYCNLRTINDPSLGLSKCAYSIGGVKDPTQWDGIQGNSNDGYCGPSTNNADWNGITFDTNAEGWRLPTEAEWEYLARGGNLTSTGQTIYSGSDNIDDVAVWGGTGGYSPLQEVCTKEPNALGLFDMSGNVVEWCWDWSGTINYNTNATGPNSGELKIYRGGNNSSNADGCSVIYRNNVWVYAYTRGMVCPGFRVVRNAN